MKKTNPSTPITPAVQHDVVARLRAEISKHDRDAKEQPRTHEAKLERLDEGQPYCKGGRGDE